MVFIQFNCPKDLSKKLALQKVLGNDKCKQDVIVRVLGNALKDMVLPNENIISAIPRDAEVQTKTV